MDSEGVEVEFSDEQSVQKHLVALPKRHKVYEEVLKLVLNAVVYLTSYPEDIATDWPEATPERLKNQATSPEGPYKQRRNAQSKLLALGYTFVHFCGMRFRAEETMAGSGETHKSAGESDATRVTWVRGTWVQQAVGPRHSHRDWRWRRPHTRQLIANDDDPGETSHVYMVS